MAVYIPAPSANQLLATTPNHKLKYAYHYDNNGQKCELGHGTFGYVYSAIDINTQRDIAIKEIVVRSHGGDINKLQREIILHSQLRHENIVQYLAAEHEDGVLKIFMEKVHGGSLSDLLRWRWGPLQDNEPAMQHYTRQMLQGLSYLHSMNIIHRDIKGSNMLIDTSKGILKLADFGTSKEVASIATVADNTEYVGTVVYMAPEVINPGKDGYSAKADIWSLGCTVVEMATASPPFNTVQQNNGQPYIVFNVGNKNIQPDIPPRLSTTARDFITRCLARDKHARPTADDLLQDSFITTDFVSAPASSSHHQQSPSSSSSQSQHVPTQPLLSSHPPSQHLIVSQTQMSSQVTSPHHRPLVPSSQGYLVSPQGPIWSPSGHLVSHHGGPHHQTLSQSPGQLMSQQNHMASAAAHHHPQLMTPQGQIIHSQGQMGHSQSQFVYPAGQIWSPQGQLLAPLGHMLSSHGHMVSPQGHIVSHQGHMYVAQSPIIPTDQQAAAIPTNNQILHHPTDHQPTQHPHPQHVPYPCQQQGVDLRNLHAPLGTKISQEAQRTRDEILASAEGGLNLNLTVSGGEVRQDGDGYLLQNMQPGSHQDQGVHRGEGEEYTVTGNETPYKRPVTQQLDRSHTHMHTPGQDGDSNNNSDVSGGKSSSSPPTLLVRGAEGEVVSSIPAPVIPPHSSIRSTTITSVTHPGGTDNNRTLQAEAVKENSMSTNSTLTSSNATTNHPHQPSLGSQHTTSTTHTTTCNNPSGSATTGRGSVSPSASSVSPIPASASPPTTSPSVGAHGHLQTLTTTTSTTSVSMCTLSPNNNGGAVPRRRDTGAGRAAASLTRSLSTRSSACETLTPGPGLKFGPGVRYCPLGQVPQVSQKLKRNTDDETRQKVINSIMDQNHIPEWVKSDMFLQCIIPWAATSNNLPLLLRLSTLCKDDTVRQVALEYLYRCLYQPNFQEGLEKLLPVLEPKLRVSLMREMWEETPCCALYRQHAYLLLLTSVYIKWLSKKLDSDRITNLLKTRDDVLKNLKRYRTLRVEQLKENVERFAYVYDMIEHILKFRLASNRLSFMKKSPALKEVHQTQKALQELLYMCKHPMSVNIPALIKTCTKLNDYDLHIFLHYIVSQVCESRAEDQEPLIIFIKQLLYATETGSRPLTANMNTALSSLYVFHRLLTRIHTPALCDVLLLNNKTEIGLHSLLGRLHRKLPLRQLIPKMCSALLFHPYEAVSREILVYGYGVTQDRLPKDAALDHISRAHKDYIMKLLSVHTVTAYTRSLTCMQCCSPGGSGGWSEGVLGSYGPSVSSSRSRGDAWHEVWEAKCKLEGRVMVSFERPLQQRMTGLIPVGQGFGASGGSLEKHKRNSLKNDIEILRILCQKATHPNIVQLLAYQSSTVPRFCVVEWLGTKVTLSELLIQKRNVRPTLTQIDLIHSGVLPMVSAVQFCHKQGILLRNITASAFLARDLGATFMIKLYAFHLARKATTIIPSPPSSSSLSSSSSSPSLQQQQQQQQQGDVATTTSKELRYHGTKLEELPLLWCAPESLLQCEFSQHSDAYMLGHTVLEVMAHGQQPYADMASPHLSEKITQILRHNIRPERTPWVHMGVYQAAMQCQAVQPSKRSSITTLYEELQGIALSMVQAASEKLDSSEDDDEDALLPDSWGSSGRRDAEDNVIYGKVPESLRNIQDIKDLHDLKTEHVLFDIDDMDEKKVQCEEKELHALDDPYISKNKTELVSRVLPGRHMSGVHLHLLRQLNHPNLLKMTGKSYDSYNHLFLRYALPPHQLVSLLSYTLTNSPYMAWCVSAFAQVASAVAYLHEQKLVHGFLAARFVYVMNDNKTVKLCQLSRTCILEEGPYESGLDTVTVQPFKGLDDANQQNLDKATRWQAREVNMYGAYSQRSDTASFATLMWEVLKARLCPPETPHTHVAPYANIPRNEVLMYQERRQTLPQPEQCPAWLYTVIKKCTLDPWYRRPLLSTVMECLMANTPSEHPLAQTPMIGDEECADIFDRDDLLYGFYEIGTHHYRKQHNYRKWEEAFSQVLTELKRRTDKHLSDVSEVEELGEEEEEGSYYNAESPNHPARYANVPFEKSSARGSSHFYCDVTDDDSVVESVRQQEDFGADVRPKIPSRPKSDAATLPTGVDYLFLASSALREKAATMAAFGASKPMALPSKQPLYLPCQYALPPQAPKILPPRPPKTKNKIKSLFSKMNLKGKARTPQSSPVTIRRASSTPNVPQYKRDHDGEGAGGYLRVGEMDLHYNHAGSRLCMDLDRTRMSKELYEDAEDDYAISGMDYAEFDSSYSDHLRTVQPPHYDSYEYDEIPTRPTKIQTMPLPPIPANNGKHPNYVNLEYNPGEVQSDDQVDTIPVMASSDEDQIGGSEDKEEDGYAICDEEPTTPQGFRPHSTELMLEDSDYLVPSEHTHSTQDNEVDTDDEESDTEEVFETPPPLPLSPPPLPRLPINPPLPLPPKSYTKSTTKTTNRMTTTTLSSSSSHHHASSISSLPTYTATRHFSLTPTTGGDTTTRKLHNNDDDDAAADSTSVTYTTPVLLRRGMSAPALLVPRPSSSSSSSDDDKKPAVPSKAFLDSPRVTEGDGGGASGGAEGGVNTSVNTSVNTGVNTRLNSGEEEQQSDVLKRLGKYRLHEEEEVFV